MAHYLFKFNILFIGANGQQITQKNVAGDGVEYFTLTSSQLDMLRLNVMNKVHKGYWMLWLEIVLLSKWSHKGFEHLNWIAKYCPCPSKEFWCNQASSSIPLVKTSEFFNVGLFKFCYHIPNYNALMFNSCHTFDTNSWKELQNFSNQPLTS